MRKTAALFDLDGVLIDSEGSYTEFWSGIDRIYPTGIKDFANVIKGNTLEKIFATYYTDEAVRDDIRRRLDEFEDEVRFPLYPGVLEMLRNLKAHGVKCAIVTSSGESKMDALFAQLPGFKEQFDTIVNGSDVTRSKPDPQGYLLAAERLGCDPADCFVFEDSIQGLGAGRASGATVIGVATTNPREVVERLSDHTIDSVTGMTAAELLGY